jgi:hypothetical protein
MFTNAKVGDRVWSIADGRGVIVDIDKSNTYPVRVEFEHFSHIQTYLLDGRVTQSDLFPILFWDELKFKIPERPKEMVKKVFEVKECTWVYHDNKFYSVIPDGIATDSSCDWSELGGKTGRLVFEYEEEER